MEIEALSSWRHFKKQIFSSAQVSPILSRSFAENDVLDVTIRQKKWT